MPDINLWMQKFRERWVSKDIDGVIELFTENVEYYETPNHKIEDKEALRKEWKSVRDQENVKLEFKIYSGDENKFTVKWYLRYIEDDKQNELRGIYLIELNDENKCSEFWQYCQLE